jgi:hypothetical protein
VAWVHPEVVRDEDRQEREGEAEAEDRGELGKPERRQVAPPVDTSRVDRRRGRARVS